MPETCGPTEHAGASWRVLTWQVLSGRGLSPGGQVCAHHDRLLPLAAVPCCKLGDGLFAPIQWHIPMVAASGQISFLQVDHGASQHTFEK